MQSDSYFQLGIPVCLIFLLRIGNNWCTLYRRPIFLLLEIPTMVISVCPILVIYSTLKGALPLIFLE